ncbi:MAG: hypothetical protein GWO10_16660 [candidate division Zixibacteria bacterium]|nr:hypothetical protein [candidate division Zixibacteria bacterium]
MWSKLPVWTVSEYVLSLTLLLEENPPPEALTERLDTFRSPTVTVPAI